MKWPLVRNLNISLVAILIALIFGGISHLHASSAKAKIAPIKGTMEIGFYDLMSDQREVYQAQIMDMDEALLFTLTRKDDAMFVLRGKLDEVIRKRGACFMTTSPFVIATLKTTN